MKFADLIIPFNSPNPGGIDFVITFLKTKMHKYKKLMLARQKQEEDMRKIKEQE